MNNEIFAYVVDDRLYLSANSPAAVVALETAFPGASWTRDVDGMPMLDVGVRVRPGAGLEDDEDKTSVWTPGGGG